MKKKLISRLLLLSVFFLMIGALFGCHKKQDEYSESELYDIYYKTADNSSLVPVTVGSHMDFTESILADLLSQMQTQIPDNPELIPPIPSDLTIQKVSLDLLPYVEIDFNSAYLKLSKVDEILCRAAITMTLTALDGISYVEITVDGNKIRTSSDEPIGAQCASNFITDNNKRLVKDKATLILYFPARVMDKDKEKETYSATGEVEPEDETEEKDMGNLLEATERIVFTAGDVAPEVTVLQELLKGPNKKSITPLLPEDVKILNHSIKNGTCYVNFNETFLTSFTDATPYQVIYGIVNSLCELPEVSNVQFLVEGKSNVKYANTIPLEEPFLRNGSYVLTTD